MRQRSASLLMQQSRFIFMQNRMAMQRGFQIAPVAVRSIHARGYNNFDDNVNMIFHEINCALMHCKNTPNIVYIYQKFGDELMTPEQIMFGFKFICNHKLEKTPEFWSVIVPMVKKQLATLDRQTVASIKACIDGAAIGYVQDNELWELVEQKLVDEGLHRYFNLEELSEILVMLGRVGRGSDDMIEIIEKTFIKHRKGLSERTSENAKIGFASVNKGSEILHRVLEDPTTQLPALE